MKHFDKDLQHLADNGFRSSEDWLSLGREVVGGSVPRTTMTHRGLAMPLFTRSQTQMKPKTVRW